MAEEISKISMSLKRNPQQLPLEDCGKASCPVENKSGFRRPSRLLTFAAVILTLVLSIYFGPSIFHMLQGLPGAVFGNAAPTVTKSNALDQKSIEVVALVD